MMITAFGRKYSTIFSILRDAGYAEIPKYKKFATSFLITHIANR